VEFYESAITLLPSSSGQLFSSLRVILKVENKIEQFQAMASFALSMNEAVIAAGPYVATSLRSRRRPLLQFTLYRYR
jgi:hypothetical protein